MKPLKELYAFYCNSIPLDGELYKTRGLGGAESALVYMAQELSKLGKQVMVFCRTEHPGVSDGVTYARLEAFPAFMRTTIMDVFISVRSADVFAHAMKARSKVLWLHDAADQPHMQILADERIRAAIDQYIVVSEWQMKGFEERFAIPRSKFMMSRNGIKRSYFKTYKTTRRRRLVYTSTPYRGLEPLLEMFPDIRAHVPDAELYVYSSMAVYGVAEAEDRERFGAIYRKCEQPGVTLVGSIPQRELARELGKAKLLVYPNMFAETSCIAALEAQAAGVPVVASRLGALEETVVDGLTGFLIPGDIRNRDARQLFVNTVAHLLADEVLWHTISVEARKRMLEHYTWEAIAREWTACFDARRPRLSVCMIVKDEEDYLEQCLNSVRPIADEYIVVDTGSHDATKAIAARAGATVYDFTWCDDFAAARNFSLTKATGDWILVLDADEVLGKNDLAKIRQLLNVPDAWAYRLFQRSYLNDTTVTGWKPNVHADKEGKGYSGCFDSLLVRLFRNHCGFQFEGAVHELIEHSLMRQNKAIINTDIPLHHYGKVREQSRAVAKGALYLSIGKAKIDAAPHDPRNYYDVAAQLFELGNLAEAKNYYLKALAHDPKYYRALCDLGCIHAKEGSFDAALDLLKQALALNQRYVATYINLGLVYQALGRTSEAEQMYREALVVEPAHVTAEHHLGLLYYGTERFQEAVERFRTVRRQEPARVPAQEYALSCYQLGIALKDKGCAAEAKEYFVEAIGVVPSFASAYNNLGVLYVNEGNIRMAEEQFKKVIALTEMNEEMRSECIKAYINLGFVYNNEGNFKQAIAYLDKGLEYEPANAEIYNHIGIAKCGLGFLQDGIKFFEMALDLAPEHQAAKVNMKRVKEYLIKERNYDATITRSS